MRPARSRPVRSALEGPTALVAAVAVTVAAAGPGYHVVNTYKLGGDGGWDYLTTDSSARRLYISRATHVMVIDTDSGKSVGDIADTPGVHGIALAHELGRGFVSNGREGTVSIFPTRFFTIPQPRVFSLSMEGAPIRLQSTQPKV